MRPTLTLTKISGADYQSTGMRWSPIVHSTNAKVRKRTLSINRQIIYIKYKNINILYNIENITMYSIYRKNYTTII